MKPVLHFVTAAAAAFLAACGPAPADSVKQAPVTQYSETVKHLQPGGEYLFFLSGKEVQSQLKSVGPIMNALKNVTNPQMKPAAEIALKTIPLLMNSGVKKLDGLGQSSIQNPDGLFSNRVVLYSKNAKDNGLLWNYAGTANYEFNLKQIPENAVMFSFLNVDVEKIYQYLKKEFEKQGDILTVETIRGMEKTAKDAGFDLPALTASLDREIITYVTEGKNPAIPLGGAILLKTKNDAIFRLLCEKLEKQGFQRSGNKLIFPLFNLEIEQIGKYLAVKAMTESPSDVLAGKVKNITENPTFQKYAKGLPVKGISCQYLSGKLFDGTFRQYAAASGISTVDMKIDSFYVQTENPDGYVTYIHARKSLLPDYLSMVPFLIDLADKHANTQAAKAAVRKINTAPAASKSVKQK